MNLFHSHYFRPSDNDGNMLYCHCGETKDMHRHMWKEESRITNNLTKIDTGFILKCSFCGEMKNHHIND